jgi:hypothetical protein
LSSSSTPDGKYRAVLLTITKVVSVSEELMPFVLFRANIEHREADPKDEVAIFNVHGTSSHFVVFMDEGKTIDDFLEEIVPYNVAISRPDLDRITTQLETKAFLKEALAD